VRYLVRLLPYMKPYLGRVVATWICVFTSGIFVMVSPILVREAINQGLQPIRQDGQIVGLDGNERLLVFAALAIIVFAIARGLTAFGQTYLGETVGQHIAYDIRNQVYNNIQRLSYAYHDQVETGQIMSRATQDVENIRMFFGMALFRLGYVVVLVVVAVVGMFVLNPLLALVSILTVPIIAWRSTVMSRRMRPVWMEIQQSQAELTQTAEESLSGIRVVKAFSREPFESEKFRQKAQQQADLNYGQAKEMAKHGPLMQGLSMLQIAITVGVGSLLIARGEMGEGDLLAFILWLNLLQLPIRTVGFLVNGVARCVSSAERVFELIDAQSAVSESPSARPLEAVRGHVRFEGVGFGYDKVSPVLAGIDIDAQPGQVIALLGPAGSGKSTVVNLIPRFYDVSAGRITIDGVDIREVTLESLRRNIGIVQQDVFLFIGTVRDNIAYGKPGATQEEIERAAKAARIHDFIVSLPDGYNEWVGERGVTLSGGQKQRIAIARTLLLDPSILIFDDSTASVDSQTEFMILQALQELMTGRTTFVIAQRLRTVMRADEIVVLDRGHVVQRGTHTELLQQEGLYRTIFDLELKDQEEALGAYQAAHRNGAGSNGAGSNGRNGAGDDGHATSETAAEARAN
jgi:ABC-type multidrug transport system fused ATPase/permease subunit